MAETFSPFYFYFFVAFKTKTKRAKCKTKTIKNIQMNFYWLLYIFIWLCSCCLFFSTWAAVFCVFVTVSFYFTLDSNCLLFFFCFFTLKLERNKNNFKCYLRSAHFDYVVLRFAFFISFSLYFLPTKKPTK